MSFARASVFRISLTENLLKQLTDADTFCDADIDTTDRFKRLANDAARYSATFALLLSLSLKNLSFLNPLVSFPFNFYSFATKYDL